MDMSKTIIPKSDQLNADDLIGGPRTITVTGVRGTDTAEQPVAVNFQGDDGKPYKPCKSMRRVMVHVWGPDAKAYVGRSMTLYCDAAVQFGGMKVGGIRISHMSHMNGPMTMALTATRAKRAPFTVQPLAVSVSKAQELITAYSATVVQAAWDALEVLRGQEWSKLSKDEKVAVKAASDSAKARIEQPVAVGDDF